MQLLLNDKKFVAPVDHFSSLYFVSRQYSLHQVSGDRSTPILHFSQDGLDRVLYVYWVVPYFNIDALGYVFKVGCGQTRQVIGMFILPSRNMCEYDVVEAKQQL
ncbi:hypothetical protein LIER_02366 [Lithospermum erythrorhizon]|uniref:Uncharacterized protein n=1 Tax=Lithospermum erythrorhizon TaxID=34254 RepID=A0AAV3NP71_LITER